MTEDTPNITVSPDEEYAYGFIIEVLTKGLYPNVFHVIREYVQNSFDAVIAWRRLSGDLLAGNISLQIQSPSVFIYDDGTGMDRDKISQYRYVGYSEKSAGEAVGFRGIGKLSGISVAEKLIVTSSPRDVPERYKLTFDAHSMLTTILTLKASGKNIPLTDLIKQHSTLTTENEAADRHYTIVELHRIKSDSKDLLDKQKVTEYLSLNAPIDFDPAFSHGQAVHEELRKHVKDYDTVPLTVNGTRVYKPFLSEHKPFKTIFVWDEPSNNAARTSMEFVTHEDDFLETSENLLAFCWYCEHEGKGQFDDRLRRGLLYRVKNFAVGDNQLTRNTLWISSPERAFYFFGEVHICDTLVIPSSERANFEETDARERLYRLGGRTISRELNRVAGFSSDERRAKDFIELAEQQVAQTEREFTTGQIPREAKVERLVAVVNAIRDAEQRLPKAPPEFRQRGQAVIERGNQLVDRMNSNESPMNASDGFYDIKTNMAFGNETAHLYDIIVDALRDYFIDDPATYEDVLKRIHSALEERWYGSR